MDLKITRNRRAAAIAATTAVGLLLAAGCSSQGGKKAQDAADDISAGKANTPRMKIAMITHAAPGDTFWDVVRKGAKTAAAKDNVELVYSSDPNGANQANLVQNAVDQKVDGIVVTLAKPDAMKGAIAKARKAGIPVAGLNSGLGEWKDQGLLEFFGQDESIAGEALGKRLNSMGAEHTICVIHEQGNVGLEDRCGGVKETFDGDTDILYVNGTDMPSVKSTITAKLKQDDSIDHVVTLGAPFALTAVKSVDDSKSDAKVATFDLNKELVAAVKDGDVELAVDQQPYLQGYLAVDALWLYENNGNFSGGGEEPVLTGPAFVDKDNVSEIEKFATKGTR
ncbi:sugar ABC transporter substrate-binding protein [Streptomyces sp. LX-29]|uniref:sugar ABC transporter substrate-binding protein n=1 Tax=Streptomyces sp. LX-29 TaxID=2900152 RepID=UPI00240E38F2|nr:sugar ABC transporter substrate-binding protein [Streptomyces sp. LX-29]WFB09446.1 sugar ABC transporter substrate-binding protein [Streptomyces sp. LX-29]